MEITYFSLIILYSLIISWKPSIAAVLLQDVINITYLIRKNKNISGQAHCLDLIVF